MNRFVTGVSDDLQDDCHSAMLHDTMNISHLMFHFQQVEEERAKRKSRDAKRVRCFNSDSSKGRLNIQYKPRFNNSLNKKPTCAKCGKGDLRKCVVRMGICFGGGKSIHMVRVYPNVKG